MSGRVELAKKLVSFNDAHDRDFFSPNPTVHTPSFRGGPIEEGVLIEPVAQISNTGLKCSGEESHDDVYHRILKSMYLLESNDGTLSSFEDLRNWNKKRAEEEILRDIKKVQRPTTEKPKALFVLGHCAAGKTTYVKNIFFKENPGQYFYINPDVLGQYFCGSYKNFVVMKQANIMNGYDSAHKDLNTIRFNYISQQCMAAQRNVVLDSNTVPKSVVDGWKKEGYDITIALIEASVQGDNMPEDETEKIEAKVKHGLINNAQRVENGEHSNESLITAKQLATVRIEALKLKEYNPVLYISGGTAETGYHQMGNINALSTEECQIQGTERPADPKIESDTIPATEQSNLALQEIVDDIVKEINNSGRNFNSDDYHILIGDLNNEYANEVNIDNKTLSCDLSKYPKTCGIDKYWNDKFPTDISDAVKKHEKHIAITEDDWKRWYNYDSTHKDETERKRNGDTLMSNLSFIDASVPKFKFPSSDHLPVQFKLKMDSSTSTIEVGFYNIAYEVFQPEYVREILKYSASAAMLSHVNYNIQAKNNVLNCIKDMIQKCDMVTLEEVPIPSNKDDLPDEYKLEKKANWLLIKDVLDSNKDIKYVTTHDAKSGIVFIYKKDKFIKVGQPMTGDTESENGVRPSLFVQLQHINAKKIINVYNLNCGNKMRDAKIIRPKWFTTTSELPDGKWKQGVVQSPSRFAKFFSQTIRNKGSEATNRHDS